MVRRIRVTQILATVGWIAATLTLGLLLSSLFYSTTPTARLAAGAFCALAIWRPRDAMLVAAAFAGLGDLLGVLSGDRTLRALEVVVIATLFGWCVRSTLARQPMARPLREVNATPVALFGLVAFCSACVWMRVDQVRTEYLSTFLAELWRWLTTQYFVENSRFAEAVSTATVLESLALYVAVAAMCREDKTFSDRVLKMLIAGGAALGTLSIIRLAEIHLRNPNAIAMLRASGPGLRISPQIPDYIAAAAYFGLCWTTALGFALHQQSRARVFMIGAAFPLMAGLFLTGSRSALGAAAGGVLVLAYLVARGRNMLGQWGLTRFAIIGSAVVALGVFSFAFQKFVGHDLTGTTAGASLQVRVELLKAGIGVVQTHPFFGVGLNRFFLYLDQFASPQLKAMWYGRLNPHNDFLRVAAEFGLVGFSLFVWTLIGSMRRVAPRFSSGVDARLAGLAGGLFAFTMTMFISNPLMVPATSYLFWIALGVATGDASASESNGTSGGKVSRWDGGRAALIAACACGIVASVPFRAAREIRAADLTGVTYGLYTWTASPDGVPSRLSGGRATLFVAADTRVVEFPISGTLPSDGPQTVRAYVDGRLADVIQVVKDWQRLRIVLPNSKGRARRIDLDVTPTWSPVDLDPSSGDRRAFGVRVGAVQVIRGGTDGR